MSHMADKNNFTIPPAIEIPYFDHGSKLSETIKHSSERRKMSKFRFVCRKVRNILLYRMAFFCPLNSWRIKMHRRRGVHIGKNVYIGQNCCIDNAYPEYIFIGDDVSLAGEVTVVAHINPYAHFKNVFESRVTPIVIEKGAWVGVKCTLVPGAWIGEYASVSAGSVVNKRVPPYTLVAGNPAKKVFEYKDLMAQ